MSTPEQQGSRLTALIVRLSGLWLLTGALFKLLLGTPSDLPQVVRDFPLELGLTYNLAIAIELCVAALALLRPRWSWLPLIGVFLVFDGILVGQIAAGDASCGCFGSNVSMPPWVMLLIDSVLLLGLFVSRPWKTLARKGAPFVLVAAALALGIALPWLLDRQVTSGSGDGSGNGGGGGALTQWKELDIESWVGQDVWDTPLAQPPLSESIDVTALPLDGIWIFYRYTCEHCAEHLAELATSATGETMIALIRLQESHDTEANRVVQQMPSGNFVQHAQLPDSMDYVLTTPAEIRVEGGRITQAVEAVNAETSLFEK